MSPHDLSPRGDAPDGPATTRGRVLVVDDDEAVRSSMVEILRTSGFAVAEAADGVAATWMIADGDFDVLVLDLSLSHLDGTAVLDALEPPATVVIVSAFAQFDEAAIRETFGSKVAACLRKPVAPERFIDEVSAAAVAGGCPHVRPIESRDALRLGLASLASLGPPAHDPLRHTDDT